MYLFAFMIAIFATQQTTTTPLYYIHYYVPIVLFPQQIQMLCFPFRASSLRRHMHSRSAHDLRLCRVFLFRFMCFFSLLSIFCPVSTNLFCWMRFCCCLWSIRFSLLHMAREHSPCLTAHHCSPLPAWLHAYIYSNKHNKNTNSQVRTHTHCSCAETWMS